MAYKPTLEDLPPESPITFQPTVADLPPTHPILSELGSVLRGIVGIPGQLARETVGTVMGLRHPLRTAQDIGEGLRAVIQNQLAPAGLDILKIAQYPVQEIAQKVAPEDVVTQAGRQFRGVQIPPYTPTHPQDPATQLARFVGTAIPVGRGAMAVERGVGLLGESLPAFLGRRALTRGVGLAAGGAATAPLAGVDPTQGAITSLLLGSAGSLGGKGFRALRKSVASPLVERGMSPSLSEILSNSQDISNSDAYDRAADNYEDASNENARRWGSVYPLAQQLTDMGVKFDRQSYINSLKKAKRTQSLSKMGIKTPEEKSAASNILDNEIKDAIGTAVDPLTLRSKSKMDTLMDAMDKRQEVNRKARSFYKADGTVRPDVEKNTYDSIRNSIRDAIQSTIDKNKGENPLVEDFGNLYNTANQEHANLINTFEKTTTPRQKLTNTRFKTIHSAKYPVDETTFINDFVPSKSVRGTDKFDQLATMIGDKEHAKDLIKSNYFRRSHVGESVNPKIFLNQYRQLSPDQQDYLFEPNENSIIRYLSREEAKPRSKGIPTLGLSYLSSLLPKYAMSALDSALGGELGRRVIQRAALSPELPTPSLTQGPSTLQNILRTQAMLGEQQNGQ